MISLGMQIQAVSGIIGITISLLSAYILVLTSSTTGGQQTKQMYKHPLYSFLQVGVSSLGDIIRHV